MKHWFLFLFSASEYWFMANVGCLPFTNSCRKIRWQRKCLISHWVVPAVNFRQQRNIWKGSPVFRTEYSKRKFVFNFFKAIFDTGFRPSRPFFGNLIFTNAIPGRHLPVLNFPYHKLYPNCESTGLPMQMVNNLCIRFHVQPELLPAWSQTMGTAGPCRLTLIVPDIFGTVSSTDTKPKLGPTILRRILPQKPWQVDISIQLENLLSAWQYWWRTAAQTLAKRMRAAMAATARAI